MWWLFDELTARSYVAHSLAPRPTCGSERVAPENETAAPGPAHDKGMRKPGRVLRSASWNQAIISRAANAVSSGTAGPVELARFNEERALGELYMAPFDVLLTDTDVVQSDLLFISRAREFTMRRSEP